MKKNREITGQKTLKTSEKAQISGCFKRDSFDHKLGIWQRPSNSKSACSLKWEYECLDTEMAARYLKVSVGSLRNMTSNGQVPVCKLGGRNRYRIEDLRRLLQNRREGVCDENY